LSAGGAFGAALARIELAFSVRVVRALELPGAAF